MKLAGELDSAVCHELIEGFDAAVARGPAAVILDLEQVTFMDSAGLQILLSAQRRVVRSGHELSVVCPEGAVRRVIELARLTETLGVVSSLGVYAPGRPAA